MTQDEERQARLAHKMQQRWFSMVANRNKDATLFSYVVDALFENNPLEAVRLSLQSGISQAVVEEIREVFGV